MKLQDKPQIKYANFLKNIKRFQLNFEHVNIERSFFGQKSPLSYAKVRRQRPLKGDKQVNHIIAPSQTTPRPTPQKNSTSRVGTGSIA